MFEEFQYDVFLSCGARHKTVMRTVAKRLQEDRLKVSYDEGARKPGDIILAMVGARLALSRVPVLSQVGEHRLADAQPHCDNWSPLVANQQILG